MLKLVGRVEMSNHEIPHTLDGAIQSLISLLGPEDLKFIDTNTCEEVSTTYHHSLGRYLRNTWGMWTDGNSLTRHMNTLGLKHADDMSAVIIEATWHYRHHVQFDLKGRVAEFQEHWKKYEM